jgi:hypothetical protein
VYATCQHGRRDGLTVIDGQRDLNHKEIIVQLISVHTCANLTCGRTRLRQRFQAKGCLKIEVAVCVQRGQRSQRGSPEGQREALTHSLTHSLSHSVSIYHTHILFYSLIS